MLVKLSQILKTRPTTLVRPRVHAWPTEALPRFAPLMEVLDGGKGWSTRRGEDAAGNMMNVVLMHKYDLKKVLAADLEQLILEGQRALDEYWLIELHRLSLERKSLVARHEVIFVQEMSLLHFDISSLRLLPKLSEGSKMYPEQVALMWFYCAVRDRTELRGGGGAPRADRVRPPPPLR